MSNNLLGETLVSEENITFVYKGDSFNDGKILLKTLHTELVALENLIKDSVELFVKNGKLSKEAKDFKIFIEIEKGSIKEKITIFFSTPIGIMLFTTVIAPFLNTTYNHFLNEKNTSPDNQFYAEVKSIENDEEFKKNLSGVLNPLNKDNDTVLINTGTINININYAEKEKIQEELFSQDEEIVPLKNGEFEETLTGVVRKIDLDAGHQNYLGFSIDNGPSRIPTSIKGEFNLLDYKNIINLHVKVRAVVRYKDDAIVHVEIISVEILEEQRVLV